MEYIRVMAAMGKKIIKADSDKGPIVITVPSGMKHDQILIALQEKYENTTSFTLGEDGDNQPGNNEIEVDI